MNVSDLFALPQFQVPQSIKETYLLEELNRLTRLHEARCEGYRRLIERARPPESRNARSMGEVPFLPVSLFKTHLLSSVPPTDIKNVLTSSGTSGQGVSHITIDAETADLQSRALASVMKTAIGGERLPMLLIDTRKVISNPALMSARGAGILGFMRFGRAHTFALDDDENFSPDRLREFLDKFGHGRFVIFGFTFMVWKFLYAIVRGGGFDLSNGTLLHSGGWKALQEMAVDNQTFRRRFRDTCGLSRIYNFYGMVEQLGSIFLEGDDGLLYPPDFADVIIRDHRSWQAAGVGQVGVVQVLSVLPRSYPGHSLLTEDLGVIEVIDGQSAGRYGKGIRLLGRVPRSELRGCSDTFAAASRAA